MKYKEYMKSENFKTADIVEIYDKNGVEIEITRDDAAEVKQPDRFRQEKTNCMKVTKPQKAGEK